MDGYHYFGKPGPIAPIALMGQNLVAVHDNKYNLYRVQLLEGVLPSNPLIFNGGALAALGAVTQQSLQNVIDMPEGNLFHFRWRVLDDIRVTLDQPQRLGSQVLAFVAGEVSAFSALYDPCAHLTERAIYWDRRPFLGITNPTQYAIAQSRVLFWGFKYIVDLLKQFDTIDDVLASRLVFNAIIAQGVVMAPPRMKG